MPKQSRYRSDTCQTSAVQILASPLFWSLFLAVPTNVCAQEDLRTEAAAFIEAGEKFLNSGTFLSTVQACYPNATSPFPALAGPSPPQSKCLAEPGVAAEQTERVAELLLDNTLALEELNFINAAGGTPDILLEHTYINSILRTISEIFQGRDQFGGLQPQRHSGVIPSLWQLPSPIGIHPAERPQKTLIIGRECLDGSISEKLGSNKEEQLGRQRILESLDPSNVSVVVASARISDVAALALDGAVDKSFWENRYAKAASDFQGSKSQGPLYPRAQMLLFYQADWFEELGVSVPNTWSELIALARTMSGLDNFVSTEGVGPSDKKHAGFERFDSWPNPEAMPDEPIKLQQNIPSDEDSGGKTTRFALCLDLAPFCQGPSVLNAIMASIVQTQGPWQNAFMDPVEVELLSIKHPELMKEVFTLYRDLVQASHLPTSLHSCSAVNHLFATGRCAMTMNWEYAFIYLYNSPRLEGRKRPRARFTVPNPAAASLVGNVGVSPLPGSERVYDRQAQVVRECSHSTCPLGTLDVISTYSQATSSSSGSAPAVGSKQLRVNTQETALVNRAPYSVHSPGVKTLCNPTLDKDGKETGIHQTYVIAATSNAVNTMFLPLVAEEASVGTLINKVFMTLQNKTDEALTLAYMLPKKGAVIPSKEEQWARQMLLRTPDLPDKFMGAWWRKARGQEIDDISSDLHINLADSRRFIQALWQSMYKYRNQAPEFISTPLMTRAYRYATAEVAFYAASAKEFDLQRAVQGFKSRSMDAQNVEDVDKSVIQKLVWDATGFEETMLELENPSESTDSSGVSQGELAGAILGSFFVFFPLMILVVSGLLYAKQQRKAKRNLLGVVLPPKAGPQTTLLLTDIQDSTHMWEILPEHISDEAVSLHHNILRTLLDEHNGYECGTEGDAFVLAFHTVADALLFATSSQVKLMLAPWPKELLKLEACRPLYVHQCVSCGPDQNPGTLRRHLPSIDLRRPHEKQSTINADKGPDGRVYPTLESPNLTAGNNLVESRGRSSGLLAFDLALLTSHVGKERQKGEEELGLEYMQLTQRYPSIFPTINTTKGSPPQSPNGDPLNPAQEIPSTDLTGQFAMTKSSDPELPTLYEGPPSNLPSDLNNTESTPSTHKVTFQRVEERKTEGSKLHIENSHVISILSAPSAGQPGPPSMHSHSILPLAPPSPSHANSKPLSTAERTAGQQFTTAMPSTHTPGPGRLLVLRGLRVRMGLASSVEMRQEDVQMNGAQGRTQYTGATMAAAKAIVDAAQGGMVLISPETFQRIPAKLLQNRLLIASMGEHVLGKGHEQTRMQLYQVLALQLVHRAAQLGPVRSVSQLSHGFLEAPCNNAAICFMNVSYLTALEMWNPVVTAAALKMWNHTVQDILTKRGGYLVEAADGLCLAAFPRPSCAIRWALESIEACLHLDWPSKLLENELGEEQFFSPLGKSHSSRFFGRRTMSLPRDPAVLHKDQQPLMDRPSVQPSMASAASMIPLTELERVLVFRGLRMKVGIDWGAVKADLHAATARVTFRGRVMNRAARISNVAKCGQVWCSEGAWEAAAPEINNLDRYPHTTKCGAKFGAAMAGHAMGDEDDSDSQEHTCVRATALGPYQLKGIVHNMELYHCY